VTNPKNLPAIFLYHILITANMQSKTGFPSSHQLKFYVAAKSRLKLAARCPVSGCWPSCLHSDKDQQMPFAGGPNTLITNPGWRTDAILEKSKNCRISATV